MTQVSVVVPTYNGARHLQDTLNAIGAQTRPPDEVLVVDDQSSDDSASIAQAHSAVTKVILSRENAGVCAARNRGINASLGDVIAFCDQDDLWHSSKLEAQVCALEARSNIDYLFTNFIHMRGDVLEYQDKFSQAQEGWWESSASSSDADIIILHRPALPNLLHFQPAFPSTLMIRRSLIDRAGQFDETLGRERSEDLEFLMRCDSVGVIAALKAPLVTVRKHDKNYSADVTETTLSQIRILQAMVLHSSRYEKHRDAIKREIARRSIMAIDGAFASGDMNTCIELARQFRGERRRGRQRLKLLVASLPTPIAARLATLLTR